VATPRGGAYLWVDFSRWSAGDCLPVLERLAEKGVLLAPGSAFGDACHAFARLCFTGVDEARLDEGIDRINAVLDAW
jgi:aspartate/methionine/tyrosine aminotransferase